jgi:hypothetical protein
MSATAFIDLLLSSDSPPSARSLVEASVHRPHRGQLWVAGFRDETGRQRWRSTGSTDRRAALVIARELERAAQRARDNQANVTGEPLFRVRGGADWDGDWPNPEGARGPVTHERKGRPGRPTPRTRKGCGGIRPSGRFGANGSAKRPHPPKT